MPPQMTGPASSSGSPMAMSRHTASPQPPTTMAGRMPHYSAPSMAPATLPSQVAMPPTSMPQGVSWHQPSQSYPADMSTGRTTWDMNGGFMDSNAQYALRDQRIPSISQSLGGYMYMAPVGDYSAQRSTQA